MDEPVLVHPEIKRLMPSYFYRFLAARSFRYPQALNGLLEAAVSVTARPDHPSNADWLDEWLHPLTMAERDAFWSKFLFGKTREENSVQRLIDWA